MSTAPLQFTGISTFSSDFQTILSRAVAIATIPVKQLQNQQSDDLSKKQLLIGLNSVVSALGNSLTSLGTLAASQALAATSSDTSTVVATDTGATSPANYTVSNVTSIASAASETSLNGYADSTAATVSSTGVVNLVVGSVTKELDLTPAENNLQGLQNAINTSGLGVTASILTTGTGPKPNFLTLTATATGQAALQLIDDPKGAATNLITATNQGSNLSFSLNNIPVTQSSNLVNSVIPGLSFTVLQKTSGNTVNLSLSSQPSQLSSALSSFVSSYNAVVDQVQSQVGPSAGQLSGDPTVLQVEGLLRQLTTFSPGGNSSIQSLADLGISLDSTGHASFDSTAFSALSSTQISDAFKFLGSASTGFGGLSANITQVTDPISGLIALEENSLDTANTELTNRISTLTGRISTMQAALNAQLQRADAFVAELQSQQTSLNASLQSLNFVAFGKAPQTTG